MPTLFELAPPAISAMSPLGRGVPDRSRLDGGIATFLRLASAHFRGDVAAWLANDRRVSGDFAARVRREKPRAAVLALMGIDKTSHAGGHGAPLARDALRIVDRSVAELRSILEADELWERSHLWVVSDHGHSAIHTHDELSQALREMGHRVAAHPWVVFARRADVAVMVSGNAMAHFYLEPGRHERRWWPELAPRWESTVKRFAERESVDLLLLPSSPTSCELRGRGRGSAMLSWTGDGPLARYHYEPRDGDPLGIGSRSAMDEAESYAITRDGPYPDVVVQIAALAASPRAGDVILSASTGWDFRERYEPIEHRSSHGSLTREHMLVPLLMNHRPAREPRRTADIMPSALAALGIGIPPQLDGMSFL